MTQHRQAAAQIGVLRAVRCRAGFPVPAGSGASHSRRRGRETPHHTLRAFTLIELLVVVGLIVIFTGGIALALSGRGGEGAALTNAQSLVSSLVGATRAQAALHQTSARLIIYAQMPGGGAAGGDAEKYLRALQIVRQETLANGRTIWVAVGDPVKLPTPVCVVPPAPVPANHLRAGVTWNNNVATGPVSTLTTATGFSYLGQTTAVTFQFFGLQGQSGRILYLEFGPDGSLPTNSTKIAVTTAIVGGNVLPQFNNAFGVRGLFVRKSGAISLVDDSTGF